MGVLGSIYREGWGMRGREGKKRTYTYVEAKRNTGSATELTKGWEAGFFRGQGKREKGGFPLRPAPKKQNKIEKFTVFS